MTANYDSSCFDAFGNVLKYRSRERAFIVRTYDALDRPLTEKGLWTDGITPGHSSSRSWRMRDATFSYWLSGRMISAATDQVTKAWTYDTAGRPVSHTASTPAPNAASYVFTYGWDVAGNLTSVGYPTTVGIAGIPNPGTLAATYAYDALSRLIGVATSEIEHELLLLPLSHHPERNVSSLSRLDRFGRLIPSSHLLRAARATFSAAAADLTERPRLRRSAINASPNDAASRQGSQPKKAMIFG